MAQPDVWVLGGYQSDFARNLHREGKDFADLARPHPQLRRVNRHHRQLRGDRGLTGCRIKGELANYG